MVGREAWAVSVEALAAELGSSPLGLEPEEAARRLALHGPNQLPRQRRRPALLLLLDQVKHFMAVLLWVAGALAFVSGTPELGWAIWAVICINAAFSFWQERKAERALSLLEHRLPADARVYRGGRLEIVPARALVPGDVVELSEGDRVSADARLLAADFLRVDLSLLTGESSPVDRAVAGPQSGRDTAEASGVVLAGSSVVSGRCRAMVYATGRDTEIGRVARLTARVEREPSTLSEQVAHVVRVITMLATGMGVAVFALGRLLIGLEVHDGLLFAIGIIVANVPEGLLPTITLALALGVQRMAQRRVLVRRMAAIETLSAVTVICTDKTGTLTLNEMSVREAWIPGGRVPVGEGLRSVRGGAQLRFLLAGAALCTEAGTLPATALDVDALRDPMESALLAAARRAGLDLRDLQRRAPRQRELPFDPARRMMTVITRWDLPELWPPQQPMITISKGAPLELLGRCDRVLDDGRVEPLGDDARRAVIAENDALAAGGYRMLAVAFRDGGEELATGGPAEIERGLVFLGLLAIMDPPRTGVASAIETCRRAGITVTMVTGDYGITAEAIAREVGLVAGSATVVSGAELATMPDERLRALLQKRRDLVFARVLPEQKLRLVQAYQAAGHVVAVTGDGVNDAPALRAAHVGIAMGANGTDVARAAADLVLLDDDFTTIVSAIEEGRSLFQNIRKFLTYILTSNVPEIVPYLAMVALRIPPALGILQILAVDLGTDMVPAMALGGEPPQPGLMDRPPRERATPLLDRGLLARAYVRLGVVQAAASMLGFFLVLRGHGLALADLRRLAPALIAGVADSMSTRAYHQASTAALAIIVVSQMGNVFACRSERLSVARLPPFSNPLIWIGLGVELVLLAAIVYVPTLQHVFRTAPLPATAWAAMTGAPVALLAIDEVSKRRAWRLSTAEKAAKRRDIEAA